MYREFLITSNNQERTFFTDDIETSLDVLMKEYPNSGITLLFSGGTKMSTKKSSKDVARKKAASKKSKDPIGSGATSAPSSAIKEAAMKKASSVPRTEKSTSSNTTIKRGRKTRFDEKTNQKILEDYKKGLSYAEIGKKYNCSGGKIYTVAVKAGLIKPKPRKK